MEISAILDRKGTEVFSVSATDTMRRTLQFFAEKHIGCAPVRDNKKKLLGLISERDICRAIASNGEDAVNDTVVKVMREKVISCRATDHQARVMALMTFHKTRHVLVMGNDNEFVGIISIGDVVKHRLDKALSDEQSLIDYISGTGYSFHPET